MRFVVSTQTSSSTVLDVSGSSDPQASRMREWELLRDAAEQARKFSLAHSGEWSVSAVRYGRQVPVATWSGGVKVSEQYLSRATLSTGRYFNQRCEWPDRQADVTWKLLGMDRQSRPVEIEYKGKLDDLDLQFLKVIWQDVTAWHVVS